MTLASTASKASWHAESEALSLASSPAAWRVQSRASTEASGFGAGEGWGINSGINHGYIPHVAPPLPTVRLPVIETTAPSFRGCPPFTGLSRHPLLPPPVCYQPRNVVRFPKADGKDCSVAPTDPDPDPTASLPPPPHPGPRSPCCGWGKMEFHANCPLPTRYPWLSRTDVAVVSHSWSPPLPEEG